MYSDPQCKSTKIIFLNVIFSKEPKPGDFICTGGAHGYDNLFPDMQVWNLSSLKKMFN